MEITEAAVMGFPCAGLVEIRLGMSSASLCWVMLCAFMYKYFLFFLITDVLEVQDICIIWNVEKKVGL
jgi:hypothetical protein